MSSTGKTEDGQTTQYSGAMNEWALVEARLGNIHRKFIMNQYMYATLFDEFYLAQFKSEDRMRLLTALKNYNESLMERSTLLEKNTRLATHNEELKMLLNMD